jgi:hypothetical protein
MPPLAGFDPTVVGRSGGAPIGIGTTNSVKIPAKNPQNFLAGFASKLLAPGVSAVQNRALIQQALQGSPSALGQSLINVGGAAMGLPGAALIGTDQLLKRTLGKGIVAGTEDLYRQTQQPNLMPGMGRQGFGGFF